MCRNIQVRGQHSKSSISVAERPLPLRRVIRCDEWLLETPAMALANFNKVGLCG